ncbi:MAG TPA: patatin-like phospholipase family protein [Candidatus Gallibacteroides avistercoris]|uniref:Patatin-like phospholipase family protein n=1 Tax=Candidatus Gallibacteroides avistercoris TaxID=2840833 RepID=A0A9D1SC05_9BACT|nr:patatin-like phospholipase family protein [Candidatus Gallibacteroides avistercoris]
MEKPNNKEKRKYATGLALSGGGARGFAHIGALKALEEAGIKPDIISGVSAGSIIGVLYADGYSPEEMIEIFSSVKFSDLVEITIPRSGFFKMEGFRSLLKKILRAKQFEELQYPLVVTATDLDHGESVSFNSGPIIDVICASCCIPVVFHPICIHNVHYVDGGVFRNFPVKPIRHLCDTVIGINVNPLVTNQYKQTIIGIAERSYGFMFKSNSFEDIKLCDILVQTNETTQYNIFDLDNIEKIADFGYKDTLKVLQSLKSNT